MLESVTNFGLPTSSMNAISTHKENPVLLNKNIGLVKKLFLICGLFGTLLVLLFAPLLSKLTFSTIEYYWIFILLSSTMFFNQMYAGNFVVLQALRVNKSIAKVTLLSSTVSLSLVIPLYFYFRNDAIVPGIIITSFFLFYFSAREVKKNNIQYQRISNNILLTDGKKILKIGFVISIANIITLATSYYLRVFINAEDGFEAVGLYNSGFAMLNTYVGLVFSAMALDYYPRLSEASNNSEKINLMVNEQGEIAILILGPILIIFILFLKYLIIILYSSAFVPIVPMLLWSSVGIIIKSTNWCLGYFLLAKADSKVYFISETISNLTFVIISVIGYKIMKFDGLGYAFTISNLITLIQLIVIVKYRYKFRFTYDLKKYFFIQTLFVLGIIFVSKTLTGGIYYVASLFLFSISFIFSYFSFTENSSSFQLVNRIKDRIFK